jgi:hypothetical protein
VWIFLLLAAFAVFGLAEGPATMRMHLWTLMVIVGVIAAQAALFPAS